MTARAWLRVVLALLLAHLAGPHAAAVIATAPAVAAIALAAVLVLVARGRRWCRPVWRRRLAVPVRRWAI